MSTYLGTTLLAGSNTETKLNAHSLFDFKFTDHKLNEMSWLRADTFSWQNGDVYSDAYNHLSTELLTATSSTETIGSYTITVYTATDGHKLVLADMETTVNNIFNETGVAWYYIVDTTNTRFKLPRTTPLSDKVKGNGIALGITNGADCQGLSCITTSGQSYGLRGSTSAYGVAVSTEQPANENVAGTYGITQDSSKSGIIIERAMNTQYKYLYFYVGEFSQTAVEQTAGITTTQLNNKLDLDVGNATSTSKSTIVGWSMSDWDSAVTLSTTVSSTYTCPSDGYLFLSNYNGVTSLRTSKNSNILYIQYGTAAYTSSTIYPVVSGEVLTVDANSGTGKLYFLKAKGV